ncbi:hypothetical protein KUW09_04745 [Mameliella alba]|nr:hypothetical protein [Antarctobacter heliothermus]MBY6143336.1 hypothetical protein [Mameliella alba]MBY6163991.1 hypothetical protein [Mameliella alba]MBY6172463.1 hypothetical protein [Mameliella alba]MBY6177477.1 hypothetical protein [Mameliella alba]
MTARLAIDTKGTSARGVAAAFDHFRIRLRQRFGAGLDALAIWRALVEAYRAENWQFLQPVVRVNRAGRRLFAVDMSDGRTLYVIFCCNAGMPVTVMCAGMTITPEGRDQIVLGEYNGL